MKAAHLALSALLTCLAVEGAQAQAPAQTLGPGDVVRVSVWRKPELSAEVTVAADGTLRHPLYQAVNVAGLPLPEVRRRLTEFVSRYEQNPQISIEPLFRVAVAGEVRQPNVFTLPPETTVSQALAMAGGTTDRGRPDRATLIRGGARLPLDLTSSTSELARSPVQSGDEILVPRGRNTFRDVIAPTAGIVAAVAAIANVFMR